MEQICEIKVFEKVECKFKKNSQKLAPDPLNIDRLILNKLFNQAPDLPDKNNSK